MLAKFSTGAVEKPDVVLLVAVRAIDKVEGTKTGAEMSLDHAQGSVHGLLFVSLCVIKHVVPFQDFKLSAPGRTLRQPDDLSVQSGLGSSFDTRLDVKDYRSP